VGSRQVDRWALDGVAGAVVVVDVIRAFSTAAYAFGSGASAIYLVADVDEARRFKADHPGVLAMGEDRGMRPDGFDFPNSPAALSRADLTGRTLVQRTSAGTQGVVAATSATRLWAASLACASATARAVVAARLGAPTYVISGCFAERPDRPGTDDRLTAALIERVRLGEPADAVATADAVLASDEARRTLALPPEHCDPADIALATRVDAFDFAMEVERDEVGLRLTARRVDDQRADEARPAEVQRADEVRPDEVRPAEVRPAEVRPGEVRA
jgi:2-phosphosulfolactate phosphatase